MKLGNGSSKIVGLQLGEATLNFIRVGEAPLKARFAFVTKEGTCGFVDVGQWSDKVIEAMRAFSELLEAEALPMIFEQPAQAAETQQAEDGSEPPQF